MKAYIFKDYLIIAFGIKYSKHFYANNERILIISFWKWALEITW